MPAPATYGCDCGTKYRLGQETSVFIYTRQPWFDHFTTQCPGCNHVYAVWQLTPATVDHIQHHNLTEKDPVNWTCLEYAPDSVVVSYAQAHGLPNVVYGQADKWRTERAQQAIDNQVAMFAYLLEKGETIENQD